MYLQKEVICTTQVKRVMFVRLYEKENIVKLNKLYDLDFGNGNEG